MMDWKAEKLSQIAQHASMVATYLQEMETAGPMKPGPYACQTPPPLTCTLTPQLSPYPPVSNSSSLPSAASVLLGTYPGMPSHRHKRGANASGLRKSTCAGRNKEWSKSERTILINCLDALLSPPSTKDRPRTEIETLEDAVKDIRRILFPIQFKESLLSVRRTGLLALDAELNILEHNPRFAEFVGGRRPHPGTSLRDLIADGGFEDLRLVASELIRMRAVEKGKERSDTELVPNGPWLPSLDRFVIGLRFHGSSSEFPVELILSEDPPPARKPPARHAAMKSRSLFIAFVHPLLPVGHPSACAASAVARQTGIRLGVPTFMRLERPNRRECPANSRIESAGERSSGNGPLPSLVVLPFPAFAPAHATEFVLRGIRDGDWGDAEAWLAARPEYPNQSLLIKALQDLASPERRGPTSEPALEQRRWAQGETWVIQFSLEDGADAMAADAGAGDRALGSDIRIVRMRLLMQGLCVHESVVVGGGANRPSTKYEIPRSSKLRIADLLAPEEGVNSAGLINGSCAVMSPEQELTDISRRGANGEVECTSSRVLESLNAVWFSRTVPSAHQATDGARRKHVLCLCEREDEIRNHQVEIHGQEVRGRCTRFVRVQPPSPGGVGWMAWPGREPDGLSGLALRNALFELSAAMRASKRGQDGEGPPEDSPPETDGGVAVAAGLVDFDLFDDIAQSNADTFGFDLTWL
mmetsp:Transcript_18565/g.51277  ORF Transcript_18565/g.51277 Transcript_18565/m.51277 type:complete len:700 (-) Transcript_18565:207-2306(-)